MAKKSMVAKAKREPKFSTRQHNRCTRCGATVQAEALRAPTNRIDRLITDQRRKSL